MEVLKKTASQFKLHFWMGALLFGILSHCINGIRINHCLRVSIPFPIAAAISAVHTLFLTFVPLRGGEVSFIVLTRKYSHEKGSGSVAGLGIMRFCDMIVFLLLCFCTVVITLVNVRSLVIPAVVMMAIVVFFIGAGVVLFKKGSTLVKIIDDRVKVSFVKYVLRKGLSSFEALDTTIAPNVLKRITAMSLVYWLLVLLQTFMIFTAFHPVGLHQFIVLFTILNLIGVAPIHGFLNVGTNEYAAVALLSRMNFDQGLATALAMECHLLTIITTALFGLIGGFVLHRVKKRP